MAMARGNMAAIKHAPACGGASRHTSRAIGGYNRAEEEINGSNSRATFHEMARFGFGGGHEPRSNRI